jgi:hypothetical protein
MNRYRCGSESHEMRVDAHDITDADRLSQCHRVDGDRGAAPAALDATIPPAISIWPRSQPPKISPYWLLSDGMHRVRIESDHPSRRRPNRASARVSPSASAARTRCAPAAIWCQRRHRPDAMPCAFIMRLSALPAAHRARQPQEARAHRHDRRHQRQMRGAVPLAGIRPRLPS